MRIYFDLYLLFCSDCDSFSILCWHILPPNTHSSNFRVWAHFFLLSAVRSYFLSLNRQWLAQFNHNKLHIWYYVHFRFMILHQQQKAESAYGQRAYRDNDKWNKNCIPIVFEIWLYIYEWMLCAILTTHS